MKSRVVRFAWSSFLLLALATKAQTLTTLVYFNGANGSLPEPHSGLIQGSDGNFYGTTAGGGLYQRGTAFKMTPDGTLTTLYHFRYGDDTNGWDPNGLVEGNDGNFYGSTRRTSRGGTIFKMTPGGGLTTLYEFQGTNGAYPNCPLSLGNDGNLYGATDAGGGTVFRITPGGALTTLTLFDFDIPNNPSVPKAAPVQGDDGNFYGTSAWRACYSCYPGTVYKLTPGGAGTTLVAFNVTNGAYPVASLVLGRDGNFYGTTEVGGSADRGTVFKMTPDGTLTTLTDFSNEPDCYVVRAGLVEATDGNFYGLTWGQNCCGGGTLFRVTPAGALTVLIRFGGRESAIGANPATLLQGRDGNLYGTTTYGGTNGLDSGTIFKITGLNLLPSFASVGVSSGNIRLTWNAVSNWTYRVQYKTNLSDTTWTDLPGDITASSTTASKTDPLSLTRRFYRLALLP